MKYSDRYRCCVLGGGVSGLIYCHYHPDALLISEPVEKSKNPFIFIQDNKYTRQLVFDLGLSVDSVSVKVKNNIDQNYIIQNKVGWEKEKKYFGTDFISNISHNNILQTLDISEYKLCEELNSRIRNDRISQKAVRIEKGKVFLLDGSSFEFEKLVSTIPFNSFQEICTFWSAGCEINSSPLYFSVKEDEHLDKNCIEYFCGREDGIIKIVQNSAAKSVGVEYSKQPIDVPVICMNDARVGGSLAPAPEGMLFLGRFATANNHWRIEDSIFVAKHGQILYEMIEEQKRIDFMIKEKTNLSFEDRILKLALHMHSEISELLREVNWKMNIKNRFIPSATTVLEEGVDIFKLLFAILNEFGYTPREFYEKFIEKSYTVQSKFIKEFYGGV